MFLGLLILLCLATFLVLLGYALVIAYEARHPKRKTAGWALAHNQLSSPEDLGLPFENWLLDTPDGLSLPVWDIPAEQVDPPTTGNEETPVVVVLHGWGRSRLSSLARMARIVHPDSGIRRDFRTILFELRGHGDAPVGPATLGSHDVDDVGALLERLGGAPVILIGHSLGAVIVIHTAVRHPEHVRAVIALSPYDRLRTPFDGNLRSRSYPGGLLVDAACFFLSLRGVRVENTIDAAARMEQPLEVLVGELDQITPPNIAKAIADAAPDGHFELIPDGAHSNLHVEAPERFIAAFERALGAARSA